MCVYLYIYIYVFKALWQCEIPSVRLEAPSVRFGLPQVVSMLRKGILVIYPVILVHCGLTRTAL